MEYIIISAQNGLSSEDRCKDFSRELFKISRPLSSPEDVTTYLFGWVNKDDLYALEVDLDFIIPIHPDHDLTTIIGLLNPAANQAEIDQIVDSIGSASSVRFGDIVPSYVEIKSREDLDADGWFPIIEM